MRKGSICTSIVQVVTCLFILSTSIFCAFAKKNDQPPQVECDLYMGESTIPHAGLGIFTSVEKKPGDSVGNGDVCIPLLELGWHNDGDDFFNPFSDYVWAGEVMGMKHEVMTGDIEAICPGLDCAINCNLALINVGKSTPLYDSSGLERRKDPSAGAITPYHNGTTFVTRKIPPGGELFKYYGDNWFTTRPQLFRYLPLSGDFPAAQRMLETFDTLFNNKDLYELMIFIRNQWPSRLLNALPATYDEALLALREDIGATYQPNATRSIEWLQENAKCVDHILTRPSTIEAAGRGGIAKRFLPKGTIITGSPVHHLPNRDFVNIYRFEEVNDRWEKREKIGEQLLLNYCWGHPATSVLLCPYGLGVNYINHNQTRANVKIQWAKHGMTSHDASWLVKTPEEMFQDRASHLAFDYVATKDILEGEELFLDYGDAFENAWQEHVATWSPEHAWADIYLDAHDWNERMRDTPLRTYHEAYHDPYPLTMQIRCHYNLVDISDWENERWVWSLSNYGYPCDIDARTHDPNTGKYLYTVNITTEPKDRWDDTKVKKYVRSDVPREAIRFFDLPYTTDMHLLNAFRHEMILPDEMLPDAWRNMNVPRQSDYYPGRRSDEL